MKSLKVKRIGIPYTGVTKSNQRATLKLDIRFKLFFYQRLSMPRRICLHRPCVSVCERTGDTLGQLTGHIRITQWPYSANVLAILSESSGDTRRSHTRLSHRQTQADTGEHCETTAEQRTTNSVTGCNF